MVTMADDVLEDIRYRVVQGFDNHEVVFDWILANYPQQLGITKEEYGAEDLSAETSATLRESIEQAFAEKVKEMESWPPVTDCDRLRSAFDALHNQGIVALEDAGLTHQEGIARAANVAAARDELGGKPVHGYCFLSWQDMAGAIDGNGLSLAYGSFVEEPAKPILPPQPVCPNCSGRGWIAPSDPTQFPTTCSCRESPPPAPPEPAPSLAQKVGHAVREACSDAGLKVSWSGLNRRGVLAREDLGLTIQDGWGYAGVGAEPTHGGVVFFHREDVIDGASGSGLLLAFGALGAEPSEDDAASAAVALAVISVLQMNGIQCSWSQSVAERIRIAPFEWQRRRWTTPPAYQLVEASPEALKRPSLFARIFGARSGSSRDRSNEAPIVPAEHCGVVVRARRDGGALDLPRTRRFREKWKALGNPGEAQTGHPGVPHIFVRAGLFFSLAPQLSAANLREDKNEIFLRGARSKAAKSEIA